MRVRYEVHGAPVVAEASPLAEGGENEVLALHGASRRAVLRRSLKPLRGDKAQLARTELALMKLFALLGQHPELLAASRGRDGTMQVVMRRYESLSDYLRLLPVERLSSAASVAAHGILTCFCTAASLGLCMLDVKPDNFLYDSQRRRVLLIDLSPESAFFWDRGLWRLAGRDCARAEALMFYLMTLLMYAQLRRKPVPGFLAVARYIRPILQESCVPWEAMARLPGALGDRLRVIVAHYHCGLLDAKASQAELDGCMEKFLSEAQLHRGPCRGISMPSFHCKRSFDLQAIDEHESPCRSGEPPVQTRGDALLDSAGKPLGPPLGAVEVLNAV